MVCVDAVRARSSSASAPDSVWQLMRNGEVYSLTDLANVSGQPAHVLVPVLQFLTSYGFAERVTRHEWLFRRLDVPTAPRGTAAALQAVLTSPLSHGTIGPQF
jgi:hypothetical protein